MSYIDFLKRQPAFDRLKDSQLKSLDDCCAELVFQQGEQLFMEGEPSQHVWILIEGKVDLKFDSQEKAEGSNPTEIHFISEASLFGWSCFVSPYQYYLSGYCASDRCKVLRMAREDLIRLFEKDRQMGQVVMSYILTVVGKHFQQFQDELSNRTARA